MAEFTIAQVRDALNAAVPFSMQMDFDNVGLLCGFPDATVTRALVALDITDAVIEEAVSGGAELIVSHHPLIFHALKRVTADDDRGRKLIRMLRSGISAICLHTNLDAARGGVNDLLMTALGGRVSGLLAPHGTLPDGTPYGITRLGELPEPLQLSDFLVHIKQSLGCPGLRYVAGTRPVHHLACCGGAGGGDLEQVFAAGCDTYVTADLKYDHFLWAKEAGLNLIDAGHFCTENVVVPHLRDLLMTHFPALDVRISAVHGPTIRWF
ncbi:MAG: Nif3-like dinuclear metal center hexameric protein [Oscillospiraceae bacterium]|nr:Nif3-like dinuclear metal center hexameric protein [Oscillospiraceae bacterium]